MPSKDTKILEFYQYKKSDIAHHLFFMQIWKKTDGCENNPENSSSAKVGKHIPSGFSMSTLS